MTTKTKSLILKRVIRKSLPLLFYSAIPKYRRKGPVYPDLCRSVLFLRPGKLGDMIVATSIFKALRSELPEIKIAVACSPYNEIIIRNNPFIDHIRTVQFHSLFEVVKLIRWIRKSHFDWVVDLTPGISRTSTLISIFSRSQKTFTAGLQKEKFSRFFDLNDPRDGVHIVELYKQYLHVVLRHRFCSEFRPGVYISAECKNRAEEFLGDTGRFLIGVNCSAGMAYRQWSRRNFDRFLSLLVEEYAGSEIILFSIGEQALWAEEFGKKYRVRVAPQTDLFTIAAMIGKLSLFFTPDTSLVHIASSFNIPLVVLYVQENGNVERWKGLSAKTKELVSGDVNEITPETALFAIKEVVHSLEGRHA